MRRVRFLLFISIFLTLVFPQWALSKLPLSEVNAVLQVSGALANNNIKLQRLDKQLWDVMKRYESTPKLWKYQILILALRGFRQSLQLQDALAGSHISVMDELREGWCSYERGVMKQCKTVMAFFLKAFESNYAIIENTAALHLMDKTIEVMKESLELTDRLMEKFGG